MRLYLARHGQAGNNVPNPDPDEQLLRADPRLTPLGRRQAGALGQRLRYLEAGDPPLILASPYFRALETAQIVANVLKTRYVVEVELQEWFQQSWRLRESFLGLNPDEAIEHFSNLDGAFAMTGRWWPTIPESMSTCIFRSNNCISHHLKTWLETGTQAALLVTHTTNANSILQSLLSEHDQPSPHVHCGLTCLDVTEDHARTVFRNDFEHLRRLLGEDEEPPANHFMNHTQH